MNAKEILPSENVSPNEELLRIADELNIEVESLENRLEMASLDIGILGSCSVNILCYNR